MHSLSTTILAYKVGEFLHKAATKSCSLEKQQNPAGFNLLVHGGVVLMGSTMDIATEALLSDNSAVTYGWGIVMYVESMSVSGSVLLVDNHAGNYGGG